MTINPCKFHPDANGDDAPKVRMEERMQQEFTTHLSMPYTHYGKVEVLYCPVCKRERDAVFAASRLRAKQEAAAKRDAEWNAANPLPEVTNNG